MTVRARRPILSSVVNASRVPQEGGRAEGKTGAKPPRRGFKGPEPKCPVPDAGSATQDIEVASRANKVPGERR